MVLRVVWSRLGVGGHVRDLGKRECRIQEGSTYRVPCSLKTDTTRYHLSVTCDASEFVTSAPEEYALMCETEERVGID